MAALNARLICDFEQQIEEDKGSERQTVNNDPERHECSFERQKSGSECSIMIR